MIELAFAAVALLAFPVALWAAGSTADRWGWDERVSRWLDARG